MLNKAGERELAYVVYIDDLKPIEGKDRVEAAVVGGWRVMVRKGQFKIGDPAIYFEIDSLVPQKEPFMFLESKKFRIKTQKYKAGEGQFWSQGLLMAAEDFGWTIDYAQFAGDFGFIVDDAGVQHIPGEESAFLTKQLGVTYYEAEDNTRKAGSVDKYKKMAQRNGKLFSHQPFRWLMKREWGKKLLFVFFGKKRDKKTGWPSWVVKTDEERIENLSWILDIKNPWIATEKVDGTSTTFTMKRGKFGKNEFYTCSRNVVFDKPDKACYYDTNVYTEMGEKYDMQNILKKLLADNPNAEWVTIQGETYGGNIQKRDYSTKEHDFKAFNLVFSNKGRVGTLDMVAILEPMGIPCVPVLDEAYILPDSIEELRAFVNSEMSRIDGKMKEGIVFRSPDGTQSFKCVSPDFLMKYHS